MELQPQIVKHLSTIRDYMRWTVGRFNQSQIYCGHGTDNYWDEAVALIFHLLHLPRDMDDRILDATLTPTERDLIVRLVETRCQEKIPVAYLTGEAWFAGLCFKVDERVLIPRSPIAELIEQAFQPWITTPVNSVLDLCTGSGWIGLSCVATLGVNADLADVSTDALEIASQNATIHGLTNHTRLVQSDLFDNIKGCYDLIVSNPPYVDEEDMAMMPLEYHHEPKLGLEAGDDGLKFAREILAGSAGFLNENGHLVLEVGNSREALEEAFPSVPFTWIEFSRGGHGVCIISRAELQRYF